MLMTTKMTLAAALLMTASAVRAETTDNAATSTVADRKFVEEAASGGMAEVKLGQLAVEKGASPTVKQFGQKMVDDHSKANNELQALAAKKSLPLPTAVDTAQQATYDKLAKLSGPAFDKAYMTAMVKDHDEDVKAFKKATTTAAINPELKTWAKQTLVVIEQHDHLAHQDERTVK